MTVRDTLTAITSEIARLIKSDIERTESYQDPYESEEPTLLDHILEDLAACELPPDPASSTDEEPFREVSIALERFVDVFFVPVMITPEVNFGMPTIMAWFELWEAQFRPDHQEFSEPNFVDGIIHEVGLLVHYLRTSHATSGSLSVPTPDGDATLTYERTPTGWSTSLLSTTGESWGFPHKLCLLTMGHSPGKYTHPVSIHDMLIEPRTYQLRPYNVRNYHESGSGSTWWPKPKA